MKRTNQVQNILEEFQVRKKMINHLIKLKMKKTNQVQNTLEEIQVREKMKIKKILTLNIITTMIKKLKIRSNKTINTQLMIKR